jgi:hypothetical protein
VRTKELLSKAFLLTLDSRAAGKFHPSLFGLNHRSSHFVHGVTVLGV